MQSKHFFPVHPREGGDSSCVEPSSKVLSLGSLGQLLLLLFFSLFYWIYIQAQLKNKMTTIKTSEIDFHTLIRDYCHLQCANSSNFMYVKNKCMSLYEVLVFIVSKKSKPKMIFFVLIRHDGDVNAVCFWGSYLISMLWLFENHTSVNMEQRILNRNLWYSSGWRLSSLCPQGANQQLNWKTYEPII